MKEKLTVIKVGGKIVEEPDTLNQLLDDFSSLSGYKVLVHGGGRSATRIASQLGIESQMVNGRRITDAETLKVVTMVYGGLVNKSIVADLQSLGVNAVGITGADFACIKAHKRPAGTIDYGYVGDIDEVNADVFSRLVRDGVTPVVAPLSFSSSCGLLNTNADTIATSVAAALASREETVLTFCFEKKGVLSDPEDEDSVIPEITQKSYNLLKSNGIISGGMIPKLDNAFSAIRSGVSKVVITDATSLGAPSGTIIK